MKSTFFTWNLQDLIKGLIVAVLTPVVPIITDTINAGSLVFDWKKIAIAALGGFVAYMAKNLFTDNTKAAVKTLSTQDVTIKDNKTDAIVTPDTVKEIINK